MKLPILISFLLLSFSLSWGRLPNENLNLISTFAKYLKSRAPFQTQEAPTGYPNMTEYYVTTRDGIQLFTVKNEFPAQIWK